MGVVLYAQSKYVQVNNVLLKLEARGKCLNQEASRSSLLTRGLREYEPRFTHICTLADCEVYMSCIHTI
jgi:hypothetical protein